MSDSTRTALAIYLARGPLIGTFLGLYGVTCMQAFFYFRTYERDGWRLKMTVALLVALETAHAAMSIWVMDDYLIVHYGNIQALQSASWLVLLEPALLLFDSLDGFPLGHLLLVKWTYILGLLIDFYVYIYFTWRIWLFTKNVWIVVFMCAISISREVISILAIVKSVLKPTWKVYLANSNILILSGNVLFIVGDTFSACAMAYHLTRFRSWTDALQQARNGDGTRRIDLLLNRLIIFFVATGATTSLVGVISLILTLTQPQGTAFLSTLFVQTRLYANSLLASLNIRNATASVYNDPVEIHANVPLQFASRSGVSVISGEGDAPARVHEVHKSDVESQRVIQGSQV